MKNVIKLEKPKSELVKFLESLDGVSSIEVYQKDDQGSIEKTPLKRRLEIKKNNTKNNDRYIFVTNKA